ncbi:homoserine kinase [Aurantiacibacter sp. D1-12]|uniref:homoserine kinase n=1 Tax=Aurantiacibacter sp. D1-12 TaxID=2993658 RepID=UPI00237C5C59|nr:homoserine kinase [Aurantiacibacter sp. D1-12]MDE1467005.1 homoserine kinase [Aurantiacibacter sp. D1-12]
MAVYTHLSAETLCDLIAQYDVGELVSAKGIAEGVSNSNWLVETTRDRFILTMYERRIDLADLPYFLGLMDHLSAKGCPVPRTIHDRDGTAFRMLDGKAVALIEFLPGVSVDHPKPAQAHAVGEALADMHQAAQDFTGARANDLGPDASASVLANCGSAALAEINPQLARMTMAANEITSAWPQNLPTSVIHSDLFPDNVLMNGSSVGALIDFYFACNDAMAYDLAVTHTAWSFSKDGSEYRAEVGDALVEGYQSRRKLDAVERAAMPVLVQGACMRFIASRTQDWIETPADALVTRKDPMDFVRRLQFYQSNGAELFA